MADTLCGRAYPLWRSGLAPLIAQLDAEPATVKIAGESVTLDGRTAAGVVHSLTLSPEATAALPRAVAHAEAGDVTELARAALANRGDPEADRLVMFYSIVCNEPWAALDPERAKSDAAGTYMAGAWAATTAQWRTACSVFPRRAERPADWRNPRSNVPALALVGGADPQDPISNIAAIRQTMPRTRILVAPGYGHGVGQIPCISRLVARFVALGTATGLDTSCIKDIATPPFLTD